MKKIIITFSVIIVSTIGVMAQLQVPDFNFESWNDVLGSTTVQDPQGWASFNTVTNPLAGGMAQTVFKETISPYAGIISAKIVTEVVPSAINVPNPFWNGHNFDTVGFVGVGKIVGISSISFGYDNTSSRAAQLSFASKYIPNNTSGGNDSSFVLAYMTKWNVINSKRDTIAIGKYSNGVMENTWTVHSINMNYYPSFSTVIPDTFMIFASSSIYNHVGAKKGSTFYVDAFAWSGYNSVNEINNNVSVSVFPNPAINNITLKCSVKATVVSITDITGRLIGNYLMKDDEVKITTENLINGVYFYSMMNDKKELISRGKFEVVK